MLRLGLAAAENVCLDESDLKYTTAVSGHIAGGEALGDAGADAGAELFLYALFAYALLVQQRMRNAASAFEQTEQQVLAADI